MHLIPVILAGGSGSRLWPLCRQATPKQFVPLLGGATLFQRTLERARRLGEDIDAPIIVCNAAHRELVAAQARELGVEPQAIVVEPAGRNTAPAVALAALLASRADADPLLLVLPADHVIADQGAFARAVAVARDAATAGRFVTFGVVADRAETGYGYIQRGASRGHWHEIRRFVEKPDLPTAESLLATGDYLWNSGMFLFSAAGLLEEMRRCAGDIVSACERALAAAEQGGRDWLLGSDFASCRADSLDYAVMQKTERGAVVPLGAGWSDVGSWSSLDDVLPHDAGGNYRAGDALLDNCRNTHVTATSRLVAAVGVENLVIVETKDAVLVLQRDRAQDVKRIVDALDAEKRLQKLT